MPIYEFRCHDCDHLFARLRSVRSTESSPSCPKCGSTATVRVLSTFAAGPSASRTGTGSGPPSCAGGGGG